MPAEFMSSSPASRNGGDRPGTAPGALPVPMRRVGPVLVSGSDVGGEFMVPLATLEAPLWPSVERGARATRLAGGIRCTVVREGMTRSILLEAPTAAAAAAVAAELSGRRRSLARIAAAGSRHTRLAGVHCEICGPLLFVRLTLTTGDAAGHNMVTIAAQRALEWIARRWPNLTPVSVSGNYCADKKVSAVNGILGRGRFVVAESVLDADICRRVLRTTPDALAGLNLRKNLVGSMLAGSVRSANAHFANMLLAFYLATGQDAANIVEGSQGATLALVRDGSLHFSVTLPNIIVGAVGAGKDLPVVASNLADLGCTAARSPGANARRLAALAAAVVLCGELSLLAAQTNPGELVRAHLRIERRRKAAAP